MRLSNRRILIIISIWALFFVFYMLFFTGTLKKNQDNISIDKYSQYKKIRDNFVDNNNNIDITNDLDAIHSITIPLKNLNHRNPSIPENTPITITNIENKEKNEFTDSQSNQNSILNINPIKNNIITTYKLEPLAKNEVFVIGANSYIGYQIAKYLLSPELKIKLRVSFDTETDNHPDPYLRIRGNDLREYYVGDLQRLESHDLCSGWEKIAKWIHNVNYIVYASENLNCLETLFNEMKDNHVLVIPRNWKDAYQLNTKNIEKIELNEIDAKPVLFNGISKGKIIELIHGSVVGEFSPTNSRLDLLMSSITKKSTQKLRVNKNGNQYFEPYISSKELSESVYRSFLAVEKGLIVEKKNVDFLKRKRFIYNLNQQCMFSDKGILESISLFTDLDFKSDETEVVDLPTISLSSNESCKILGNCHKILCDSILDDYSKWYLGYYYPKNFIMTTYLTSQGDPQRNRQKYPCTFDKMKEFYNSIHRISRVNPFPVFIFYDECQPHFIKSHETQYIRFVKVDKNKFTRMSPNDERFSVFEEFLENLKKEAPSASYIPDHVIWSDLFDVVVNKNPFEFMESYELEVQGSGKNRKYFLYPGKDNDRPSSRDWFNGRIRDCDWTNEFKPYLNAPLVNAGVCGGTFDSILLFITKIKEELKTRKREKNCNMPAYNLVLNRDFKDEFRTGPPFTSPFFENNSDTKYYIKHK